LVGTPYTRTFCHRGVQGVCQSGTARAESQLDGCVADEEIIPGTVNGKFYKCKGIQKYSGRGKFSHLKGTDVIVLESKQRKRPIILFLEPLLLFVNSDSKDLDFGRLPIKYIEEYRNGKTSEIPNLYEYESHYKSLARYIQRLSEGSDMTKMGLDN
jgi:hypothetical protein